MYRLKQTLFPDPEIIHDIAIMIIEPSKFDKAAIFFILFNIELSMD